MSFSLASALSPASEGKCWYDEWNVITQKHIVRLEWFLDDLRTLVTGGANRGATVLMMTGLRAPSQVVKAKTRA